MLYCLYVYIIVTFFPKVNIPRIHFLFLFKSITMILSIEEETKIDTNILGIL